MSQSPTIICSECGTETPRRGPGQKYCTPCSVEQDRLRRRNWARKNPPSSEQARVRTAKRKSRIVREGAERSIVNRADQNWLADAPDFAMRQAVKVVLPFSYRMSKNAVWSLGARGHVFARQESNAQRAALSMLIRNASGEWFDGKIWIDIFVEKPNHKGDAVNMVDLVCDAIKDATDVDDRWYCLRRLDWAIVKKDPMLRVGVSQEVTEHHRCCSHCGRILTLDNFGNRSDDKRHGKSRVCWDCSKSLRKKRAAA